jgi:hypothetical protein
MAAERGVHGWFFKAVPQGVPVSDCLQHGELTLLYLAYRRMKRSSRPRSRTCDGESKVTIAAMLLEQRFARR